MYALFLGVEFEGDDERFERCVIVNRAGEKEKKRSCEVCE